MKPIKNVFGSLGFPAVKGNRVVILPKMSEGIWTSQIVAIRNETADGIEIETLNTIYKVTFSEDSCLPIAN